MFNDDHDSSGTPSLSPEDRSLVDATLGSGEPLVGASGDDRRRALSAIGDALADVPLDADREARIDAVLDALRAEGDLAAPARLDLLSDEAVEALVMRGFDAGRAPNAIEARVSRAATAFAALEGVGDHAWIASGRASRIETVLEAIDRAESPLEFEQARRLRIPRMADLAAMAALLVLGVTLVSPLFGTLRGVQRQTACLTNLGAVSQAFGLYASDHMDALPAATDRFGASYVNVGTTPEQSNSANLFVLTRAGYADLADLACPGNEHAIERMPAPDATDWAEFRQVSYSYRLAARPGPSRRAAPAGQILMADRSPVMLGLVRGEPVIIPEDNSPQHGGRGQHVLTMGGAVTWIESPVLRGDNIWLPRPIEEAIRDARRRAGMLKGSPTELPADAADTFLGP